MDERNQDPWTCGGCDRKLLVSEIEEGYCPECAVRDHVQD
jgi:hypothetical protein